MTDRSPAYPCIIGEDNPTVGWIRKDIQPGAELRDVIAYHALMGMLSHQTRYVSRNPHIHWHEDIVREAYEIADAAMEERVLDKPAIDRMERMQTVMGEASKLFRLYQGIHEAKGNMVKAKTNEDMARKIEEVLWGK